MKRVTVTFLGGATRKNGENGDCHLFEERHGKKVKMVTAAFLAKRHRKRVKKVTVTFFQRKRPYLKPKNRVSKHGTFSFKKRSEFGTRKKGDCHLFSEATRKKGENGDCCLFGEAEAWRKRNCLKSLS